MARKRPQHSSANLPGSLYQRNGRWWWKVQLPGETKTKARPLKPVGSRYATTDHAVATECAKQLLAEHLFQKDMPLQGDVHIVPDLVRAYMTFAKEPLPWATSSTGAKLWDCRVAFNSNDTDLFELCLCRFTAEFKHL